MSTNEPAGNPPSSENQASHQEPEVSMWSESNPGAAPAVVVAQGPSTSSNAIVALVLSIVSWVVCPVIFAIVALVFASKADKEIASSSGRIGGGSLATASKILSWINIGVFAALFVLGILVLLFLTIAGVSSN